MKSWIKITLAVITAASLTAEFTAGYAHGHSHWWNGIPGFFIYFGLAGCILLILLAKALGKNLVSRDEEYYDRR
jgi:hypothetical protein